VSPNHGKHRHHDHAEEDRLAAQLRHELDLLSINTIRTLAADAVQKANSGHPGAPMGLAPAAYVLWHRFLKHNPANPTGPTGTAFVLSAGHASMLLYSLHLPDRLRADHRGPSSSSASGDRKTPGHPEHGHTPGVETTTGPLGQGFATGVGMAIAERELAARYNRPGFAVVNHHTYAICSDGDMMEGVSHESASLAGHLRLGKMLIYLYDANQISIDGSTELAFTEDVGKRFEAYQWHVQHVPRRQRASRRSPGHRGRPGRPRGRRSSCCGPTSATAPRPSQDSELAHGQALARRRSAGRRSASAGTPTSTSSCRTRPCRTGRQAGPRGAEAEATWNYLFSRYKAEHPDLAAEFERVLSGSAARRLRRRPARRPGGEEGGLHPGRLQHGHQRPRPQDAGADRRVRRPDRLRT